TADGRVLLDLDKGETTHKSIERSVFLEMGAFPFMRGGKWGIMSTSGEILAEPRWKDVGMEFCDTLPFADEASGKWGLADVTGKIVVQAQFEKIAPFAGDYAPVLQTKDGQWGLIDRTGKLVHEYQWDRLSPFSLRRHQSTRKSADSRELFWVSHDQKWCVFDAVAGKYVFESDSPVDGPTPLATGNFFQATKSGRTGWWHVDGSALVDGDEPQTRFSNETSTTLRVKDKAAVRDAPPFDTATLDRLPMKRGGKYGLADMTGRVLGSAEWDRIQHTSTLDYFVVKKGGLLGIIDREGKVVEVPTWKGAELKDDIFITNPTILPDGDILVQFHGSTEGENPDALFIKTATGLAKVAGKSARSCFFPEEAGGRHAVSGGTTFVLKPGVETVFGPAHNGLLPVDMWGVACAIRPSGEIAFPANVVEPEKRAAIVADYGPFYLGKLTGLPGGWILSSYEKRRQVVRLLTPDGSILPDLELEDVRLPETTLSSTAPFTVLGVEKDRAWGYLRFTNSKR
ncbi:MAG: WG repeat-containing protein, partial [Verrucomicrobiaceae bacterium]|nr:WG repeat-containing protein [Verrucomicrobiaceae bacterium]